MTYYECRRHTDVKLFLSSELLGYEFTCRLTYRFQSFNEQRCDTGDKLHHRTHLYSKSESGRNLVYQLVPVLTSETSYDDTDNHSEYQRLAEDTEFLLHSL